MIEASQRMITICGSNEGIEGEPLRGMNPATKRHLTLQIKAERGCNRERRHREIGNRD
jgi:hypothetical protein